MKKQLLILLGFCTLINLTSCENSFINDASAPTTFNTLKISPDFDWKMTSEVICNFKSENHSAKVFLYLTDATKPFASLIVGKTFDPVTISLTKGTQSIIVKYQKENDLSKAETLNIVNGTITYTVPTDSKKIIATPSAAKSKARIGESLVKPGTMSIYYPASAIGTLMYEDLWPFYGDFDFNDMSVNYFTQMILDNNNRVTQMYITLRTKAAGGSLPYDLYLQLKDVSGAQIDLFYTQEAKNFVDGPYPSLLNGKDDKNGAIFLFNNLNKCKNRPAGGSYFNTSLGYEVAESDLLEATFYIDFGYGNSIHLDNLKESSFDFFIAATTKDGKFKEIHTGGNKPTMLGRAAYNELKASSTQTNKSSNDYYSNSNLVWAVNIPANIQHPYEKISIIEAYPLFKKWAESNGTNNIDWYKHPDIKKVVAGS